MKKIFYSFALLLVNLISYSGTIVVDSINDNGTGSLREAINNSLANDTIRFNPNLIIGGNNTIVLNTEISFAKPLVFIGLYNSTDTLFISGNNSNRIFNIDFTGSAISNKNVGIDSLVLVNGNATNGGAIYFYAGDSLVANNSIIIGNTASAYGGAIYSNSVSVSIILTNSFIAHNTSNRGGGIYSTANSNSDIMLINSEITKNTASYYGGGISSISSTLSSSITLTNSTISGNNSINSLGGGVFSSSYYISTTILTNSTISGNTALSNGAGIYTYSDSYFSSVALTNSTVSGNNTTNGNGGGIYSVSPAPSTITLSNSTFFGNNTNNGMGGGIYSIPASLIQVSSSIVALNGMNNILNGGVDSINSQGYNIFSGSPIGSIGSDQINIDSVSINLLPLANNGGTTQTMLPGTGSVAIDMGNPIDSSDAQNIPITKGRRDAGAAEIPILYFTLIDSICSGDSLLVGGKYYISAGTYNDTVNIATGGDSVITLILGVLAPIPTTIIADSICVGDSILFAGKYYNVAGTYNDILQGIKGCDSIVSLTLSILAPIQTTIITDSICVGDSILFAGKYYNIAGTYNDTLQSSNGCDSITTLTLQIKPSVSFTALSNYDTINAGDIVSFSVTGSTATSYLWGFGDNNQSSSMTTAHSYNTSGTYTVVLKGEKNNICPFYDTLYIVVEGTISINETQTALSNINIYPNPSINEVTIEASEAKNAIIKMFDSYGKLLYISKLNSTKTILSLTDYINGVYFVDILLPNGDRVKKKVIIQK
jgi:hypothetical protein